MTNKLDDAFNNYIELVKDKFDELTSKENVKGPLRIITNESLEIRRIVDQLEKEAVFQELVKETSSEFSWRYNSIDNDDLWDYDLAIKRLFRRLNIYYDIYKGYIIDYNKLAEQFNLAFSRKEINVTYLAPIIGVKFAEDIIDVGYFQLRKFSVDELETLFQNKIREIFCPELVFDMDLIDKLTDLWFIKFDRKYSPHNLLDNFNCAWDKNSSFFIHDNDEYEEWLDNRIEYAEGILEGNFPEQIIDILRVITLFDWQSDIERGSTKKKDITRGNRVWQWGGIRIPFVLLLDDNVLSLNCSPISELYAINSLFFTDDINLDEEETHNFKSFLNKIMDLLVLIKDDQNKRKFLKIALNSMVKAFFTEGLEQLLWHMISLEALLGEKGEGTAERLSRRLSNILGKTNDEKKSVKKIFKELYNFRCDLSHGNTFKKPVYTGHLWVARELCRKVLLWFVNYLAAIQIEIQKNSALENIPSREDILTLIDQDATSRKHLTFLLANLPDDFPFVKEWIG
jgi:hypothetical protein